MLKHIWLGLSYLALPPHCPSDTSHEPILHMNTDWNPAHLRRPSLGPSFQPPCHAHGAPSLKWDTWCACCSPWLTASGRCLDCKTTPWGGVGEPKASSLLWDHLACDGVLTLQKHQQSWLVRVEASSIAQTHTIWHPKGGFVFLQRNLSRHEFWSI